MKHTFLTTALIVCLLSGAGAQAQTLPHPAFEKYTLANGLDVILYVDKKIPAVNVTVWYHVGSKNERPGRTGFAHLFEHMMFQGSKHVKGEYISLAQKAGANVNGSTTEDRTNYYETVPSTSLEYALWMESDRMGFLLDAANASDLKNQQDVVKNEKRQGDNAPYSVVQYIVADNLYPAGHPYAHTVIGSMDDLTAASLDDVKEFYRTWYVPNNATLVLSGDFDTAEAKRLVEKYFGPIPAGQPLTRPKVDLPFLASDRTVVATDRVPQARLYLDYVTPQMYAPEEAPLNYAASVFGQGKTSILYKKLVRERELASDVMVRNGASEISGEFMIVVTARPGVSLDEIRTAVDEEIAAFAKRGPSADELEQEKARTAMRFISSLERVGGFGGVSDRLAGYNTWLGTPDYFEKDYERFQKVTPEDARREFARWVADAHRLEIRIVPETSKRPDAKEFDRTVVPPIGGAVAFTPPAIQSKTLPNGLEVVVATRAELPLTAATLLIKSADRLEPADKAGESSLTAAMVDEGTTSRNALQIQDDLQRLGSSMNVGGGKMGAAAAVSTLKKNLDPTLDILADVALHPAFPKDEFERQRKLAVVGIARSKSSPTAIANRVFSAELYGLDNPLGRSSEGTERSMANITVDDVRRNYETYWKPNNAVLVFAGDVTLDEAVRLAEKHFGSWKHGDVPQQALPPVTAPAEPVVYLVDRQNAPQSEIRIGSIAPPRSTPDYYALTVMNAILGGGFTSRINLNLREEKGYTYGARSVVNSARDYGSWIASGGVQTNVTKEALVEFRKEIDGISGPRPVTDTELAETKARLTRAWPQSFETLGGTIGQITALISDGLPFSELGRFIPSVEAQGVAAVMDAAKKHIDFRHSITVIVGDLGKIEAGVRSLNWGKVVVVDENGTPVR